jgi:PTS system mannose-specific IIA component
MDSNIMNNGIILITHAPLASAMLDCVSHVYGYVPENILPMNVHRDDSTAFIHKTIMAWIENKSYDGYLILNDLYGASPFNIAKSFVDNYPLMQNKLRKITTMPPLLMLTGLSLPMLMKSVCHQNLPLEEMAHKALDGIIQCSTLLQKSIITTNNASNLNQNLNSENILNSCKT